MTNFPPGWPSGVVLPTDPDFETSITKWLLDQVPGEFRSTPLVRDPIALGWVVRHIIADQISSLRRLYSLSRSEESVSDITATMNALSTVGADLVRVLREVDLVRSFLLAGTGISPGSDLD